MRQLTSLTLCLLQPFLLLACHSTELRDRPTLGATSLPSEDTLPPLADYFAVRRLKGASFRHDEQLVAYLCDAGGRLDIWVQPVNGGEARQLTRVQGKIFAFAFSPTRDQLLFEVDSGGNSETRLYLTDSQGSPATALFPDTEAGARVGFISWARDGNSFLFVQNLAGQDFVEIFRHDLKTAARTLLWRSPAHLAFALASPDGERLILQEVRSDVDFNLFLLQAGAAEPRLLTPHQGEVAYQPTAFSPDGKTLFYTSTEGTEFTALNALDLPLPGDSTLAPPRVVLQAPWDVEQGQFSAGGRYFYTVTNLDGMPHTQLTEVGSGRAVELAVPGSATAGSATALGLVPLAFSQSDRWVAAMHETDTRPPTLFLLEVATGNARQLVEVLPESLRGRAMVASQPVRIRSWDGLEVPALLYQPPGPGPFPAVIHVHGGPHAQAKRSYSGFIQYLVSRGYVVLAPNVRGSTGYGKSYTARDNLDLGGGPLRDVLACKRWLVERARVDPERVAIMGASYGGYMALAAATFAPTEFAAHVDYFGISDMKALVKSYPAYWKVYSPFTFKKWGDPDDPAHADYQFQRSPIHFTDRIVKPLLVVQGENDPHVPRAQSDQLVAALDDRRVPVHYLVIPGEGHGFSKNANRLLAYATTDRFLSRYLLGQTEVAVLPEEAAPQPVAAAQAGAGAAHRP